MKKIILTLIFISFNLTSAPYETAQRFNTGDTISADVLNDILDRIELTLKPLERSELIGSWSASEYVCAGGIDANKDATNYDTSPDGTGPTVLSCNNDYKLDNATNLDGLAMYRTDVVNITEVAGSDIQVNVAFETNSMIAPDGLADTYASMNQPKIHQCSFYGGSAIFACALDDSISTDRRFGAFFNVQRLSSTRIKLFWGPYRGSSTFKVIILDKNDQVPKPANTLVLASPMSPGVTSIALSWSEGDNTVTEYDIQRKSSPNDDFVSIGTSSTPSYDDSAITKGNSYWYRVFSTNANGMAIGSNVIQITYANTPPSLNLRSILFTKEGSTEVGTISASDADGDSLTYSVTNHSYISNTDAELFGIDEAGVLSFLVAPEYISGDSDANTYDIKIVVSDGIDEASQDMTIVVSN